MRYGTDLLGTSNKRLDGWALDRGVLAELDAYLHRVQPRSIVECGSGLSTLLFARYAKASGASVVSLEHEYRYWDRTGAWLKEEGLTEHVDLLRAPLVDTPNGPWYAGTIADLPYDVDFALIDGPPQAAGGRAATFPELLPHLRPDGRWEVWVDDADREGEIDAMVAWNASYGQLFRAGRVNIGRGLVRLTGKTRHPDPDTASTTRADPGTHDHFDAHDVVLTILTGGRPDLLNRTLASLNWSAPGLLDSAAVVVLNNGSDEHTERVIRDHTHRPDVYRTSKVYPIGPATSELARHARNSGREYWLHLEDDWVIQTAHPGWLDEARDILKHRPSVHQVRLRHLTEPTLLRHMVSKRPILWRGNLEPTAPTLLATAHWTFNPALTRTSEIHELYPAAGEDRVMRAAHHADLDRYIAQHVPGVFRHTGGDDSLADKTKGR